VVKLIFLRVIVMELVVDTSSVPYESPFISRIHVSPTNDTWILENYKENKGIWEGIKKETNLQIINSPYSFKTHGNRCS
jgi:hypothetical protein